MPSKTFTREVGGKTETREAHSSAEAVQLAFNGWKEVQGKPPAKLAAGDGGADPSKTTAPK